MFTGIKTWFFGTPTKNEGFGGFLNTEDTMKATIQPVGDKFGLFTGGELVGTYARKRDAVRGASRRELHLI
jgi:hypothetical protein